MTPKELLGGINWWADLLKNIYNYEWSRKDEQFLKQIRELIEKEK